MLRAGAAAGTAAALGARVDVTTGTETNVCNNSVLWPFGDLRVPVVPGSGSMTRLMTLFSILESVQWRSRAFGSRRLGRSDVMFITPWRAMQSFAALRDSLFRVRAT